jgi:succinate-semialdehyde dehydrogenase/glutarate-semialdehyde dehydrogenase
MATEPKVLTRLVTSHNPATGEVLGTFACASENEVHAAADRAQAAQPAWAALGVRQRIAILRHFQRLLLDSKEDVARLITREVGKPYPEALVAEVIVTLDAVRFCTGNVAALLRPERVPHGNPVLKSKSGRLVREPHGVIGIVSPWNYPFSIPATQAIAALAAGNAVLLKPSEFTTLTAHRLVELLHQAGVPEDVLQLLPGDGPTGAALLAAKIDKVFFTGSVPTGKRVAQAAAARLLPVVLELGGKDPMLVLEDADVDIASSAAVWGSMVNAGQTCLSIERCYVHRSLFDSFVSACVEKVGKLRVGSGENPNVEVGPMIHEQQLRIVESQVEEARSRGARVLTGGVRLTQLGPTFYAPTVVVDVNHSMRLIREETFGPVLAIMPFAEDDEAVRLANDSDFGLAASIWTTNRRRGEAMARRLNAGAVMVNDAVTCFGIAEAPHGGVKASGLGRTNGRLDLDEMVRAKYIDSDRLPRMPKLWWYEYSAPFVRQMEGFADFLFARHLGKRLTGGVRSLPALWRKRL